MEVDSAWHWRMTGWPIWVALPLGVAAAYALWRLHRLELASLPDGRRRLLHGLRTTAVLLLALFFAEPSFTRRSTDNVLPRVAVIVDRSGSMAVRDASMAAGEKAAEAAGLRLLPAGARRRETNAAAQAAADEALVRGARGDGPISRGLAQLDRWSRYERALAVARDTVAPALQGRGRVSTLALDTDLVALDWAHPGVPEAGRGTDFERAFGSLARNWAQEPVGGVVLISDGRQTSGGDPGPAVRALHSRGVRIDALFVGDPDDPPDAVVAEVSGPSEVFLGENAPLTVRYRISRAGELDFDLIVTQGGRELARRSVRGSGQWEYEHFTVAATNPGVSLYQARLELSATPRFMGLLTPSGTVTLETWSGVPGAKVRDFTGNPASKRPPDRVDTLTELQYRGRGQQYAARVRGFFIPPQTGWHTFWIASDDGSELWLSPDGNPLNKARVASVSDYVPPDSWDSYPSQKSEPVALAAGRPCYFEIIHKQGSGDDHLSVGWQLPDGTMERPVRGGRFSAFSERAWAEISRKAAEKAQTLTNAWQEASAANNSAEWPVAAAEDPIHALLADASPRWETRYLAAMLERDRRVRLTRRYHDVIVDDPGVPLLPRTQSEWDGYDLVCLGDLDAAELPPEQQQRAADFVGRRGGFLVIIAGPRGMPRAFNLGAMANLLPIRPAPGGDPGGDPVRLALTADGFEHPITQVLDDPQLNKKLWPLLPPFDWVAGAVAPKPGATVLIEGMNRARTPVVAVQRYGAGRVFWIGAEESWRWRDRLGERVHQTFWLQALRWGLAGRLRGKDARLEAGLDRYLMDPGESAELRVRAAPAEGAPSAGPPLVRAERTGADPAPAPTLLPAFPLAGVPGLWRIEVGGLEEGVWRLTITHPDPRLKGLSETRELTVRRRAGVEEFNLAGDPGNLARLAAAGGGRAATLDQADELARSMASGLRPRKETRQKTVRLWNNAVSMLVVMALLCLEWFIRKRSGLP